jgi:hypothetical protein
MATKYTTLPKNGPNGHKIFQHITFARASKIYPNWDFLGLKICHLATPVHG